MKKLISGQVKSEEFKENNKITEIVIEAGANISRGAFFDCKKLKKITFCGDVTLGNSVFNGCSSLETVEGSENIDDFPVGVFSRCKSLKTIKFKDEVNSIEDCAFSCSGIETIVVPYVKNLFGDAIFAECNHLRNVQFSDLLKEIPIRTFEHAGPLDTVIIGNGIKEIGNYAFFYSKIKNIVISPSVEVIGSSAFAHSSLKNIDLSKASGLQHIDTGAFDSTKITTLDLSKTMVLNGYHGGQGKIKVIDSYYRTFCV